MTTPNTIATDNFAVALRAGQPQFGLCIMYPAPGMIERIGSDWDWIWIDGQHGELGYQDLLALVRACDLIGRPAFVRVPGHETGSIGLALDMGAAGVIVPLVESADDARRIVTAAKFPPLGSRSYGGRRPIDRKGRLYSDTANTDVLLVAQIESPEAIEHVDEIAAVPGIDALFLGPDDILLRRGVGMTAPRNGQILGADMTAVAAACRRHKKHACMVAVSGEMIALSAQLGFNLIVAGGDVPFLAQGSKAAAAAARAAAQNTATAPCPPAGNAAPY